MTIEELIKQIERSMSQGLDFIILTVPPAKRSKPWARVKALGQYCEVIRDLDDDRQVIRADNRKLIKWISKQGWPFKSEQLLQTKGKA